MSKHRTHAYIEYACAQEVGSFSDTESKHQYDNVSAIKAAELEAATESTHLDRDGSPEVESVDQRHNVWFADHDCHDNPYPAKYNPGR